MHPFQALKRNDNDIAVRRTCECVTEAHWSLLTTPFRRYSSSKRWPLVELGGFDFGDFEDIWMNFRYSSCRRLLPLCLAQSRPLLWKSSQSSSMPVIFWVTSLLLFCAIFWFGESERRRKSDLFKRSGFSAPPVGRTPKNPPKRHPLNPLKLPRLEIILVANCRNQEQYRNVKILKCIRRKKNDEFCDFDAVPINLRLYHDDGCCEH